MDRLKDESPLRTITKIRNILHSNGICVKESWIDSGIPNIYSVRIVIAETDIGTNGKGATEHLALASGYGEFMERLQNGLLFSCLPRKNKTTHLGCLNVPTSYYMGESPLEDAVLFGMKTFEENLYEGIRKVKDIGKQFDQKKNRLKPWQESCNLLSTDGTVLSVPFVELQTGKTEYLPVQMLCAYGSHGMAAGNTYLEAMVQGISEIFERYAQKQILENKLCPPIIPIEILKKNFPSIGEYVSFIEKHNGLHVELRDCSLGLKIPAYCICISNITTHNFSIAFGSHPNIGVALERLFTEVFQGRTLDDISNRICSDTVPEPFNSQSIFQCAIGNYPLEFWSGKDSYPMDGMLLKQEFKSNSEAFKYCLSMCRELNTKLYVRDVGYLGFPAVHIIAPGLSEILCCNELLLKHHETTRKVSKLLMDFDNISNYDKELIMEFFDFDRKIGQLTSFEPYCYLVPPRNNSDPLVTVLHFIALIAMELGMYDRARYYFDVIARRQKHIDTDDFECLSDVCKLLGQGYSQKSTFTILKRFYSEDVLNRTNARLSGNLSDFIDTSAKKQINKYISKIADKLWGISTEFQSHLIECIHADIFAVDEKM